MSAITEPYHFGTEAFSTLDEETKTAVALEIVAFLGTCNSVPYCTSNHGEFAYGWHAGYRELLEALR